MVERFLGGLAIREWGDPGEPGILLWPGLGATATYFAPIAESLPGRVIAVDPPGFGGSSPVDPNTREAYVDVARQTIESTGCRAMIGHSLGAYVALDVAARPPAALRAVAMIDGGFLGRREFRDLGMPIGEGRGTLIAWLEANDPHFPDWETATTTLSAMLGVDPSPMVADYVRDIYVAVDGEIRSAAGVDRRADLLLAILEDDAVPEASDVQIPTLLIGCGQPIESRAMRQAAWERLVESSPLLRLHVADEWGHNPVLQAPDAIGALLADWLRES
jgi:pimeloyl-ACP methyl ester carboxylesterase